MNKENKNIFPKTRSTRCWKSSLDFQKWAICKYFIWLEELLPSRIHKTQGQYHANKEV